MKNNRTKNLKKGDLPTKICAACGKPMTWRKRWEKIWAEVKFCSERCRQHKNAKISE